MKLLKSVQNLGDLLQKFLLVNEISLEFLKLVDFSNYFHKNYEEFQRNLENLYCRFGVLLFLIGLLKIFWIL